MRALSFCVLAACGVAERTTAPEDVSAVPSQAVVAADACERPACLAVTEATTRSLEDGLCLTLSLTNGCSSVVDAFPCIGRKRDDRPADSQCWSFSIGRGGQATARLCHATGRYSLAAGDPTQSDTAALRDACPLP